MSAAAGAEVKVSTVVGMRTAVGFVCAMMLALIATIIAVPLSLVTPASIYLYSNNVGVPITTVGNRVTSTAYCNALAQKPYLCGPNVKMLVSYVGDPISVTTPLRPVRGPTGVLIASSFNALISNSIALTGTLRAAGLGGPAYAICPFAWTGINSTGGGLADATSNCDNFTDDEGTLKSGSYNTTTQPWFSQTDALATCETNNCVICVCY